jgi:hypothetical protein
MLVIFLLLGLHTKLVDYAAAFVHANIDRDPNWGWMSEFEHQQSGIYIQMLKGFQTPGHILKLKKSLNGLKQSPKGQACQHAVQYGCLASIMSALHFTWIRFGGGNSLG